MKARCAKHLLGLARLSLIPEQGIQYQFLNPHGPYTELLEESLRLSPLWWTNSIALILKHDRDVDIASLLKDVSLLKDAKQIPALLFTNEASTVTFLDGARRHRAFLSIQSRLIEERAQLVDNPSEVANIETQLRTLGQWIVAVYSAGMPFIPTR